MAKDETQTLYDLRTDLGDIGETEWDAVELQRAVERAYADLSRFLPRELEYEITLSSSNVSDDVRIDLTDYINADGGMEEVIRIHRVEFPTGQVPQSFVSFDYFANILTITGLSESGGQQSLATGDVMRIYYDSPHVAPDDDESGTCPVFLENTILLAAGAYALFQKALDYLHQANTDYTSARTALTDADTALNNVDKYLANNSNEDSAGWLTKITTDVADLRTAIKAAVDACNAYLDKVGEASTGDLDVADAANGYIATYVEGGSAPSVDKYLDDGDALLNTIADGGEGQEVPNAYRQFAQTVHDAIVRPEEENRRLLADNAVKRTNAAMIYAQEAAQRLSNLRSYIEQADAYGVIAQRFINEAEQRLADSIQYNNVATNNMALADKFKEQATERRNEAWSIWRDRTQYIGDFSQTPVRQMPQYS